ncbi:MAG TPA: MFS transporter [Rhizomicrobium sp.]|nr:MFS transporter [Rhizomicrobium sp.]
MNRAWLTLGLMSALFFIITAATFDSLGLVLPAMVAELGWSWTQAGLGFTLLAVFCGVTATVPAALIRRLGVRANLLIGSAVMGCAYLCLARAHGLALYFIGASLAGLGFTLLDTVPGTYLLARLFPRPAFAIGLYFTIGGLGAIFGPLFYFAVIGVTGEWRSYWILVGALVVAAGVLAALLVDARTDVSAAAEADPDISPESWTARAAMKTVQFWVLAAAYSAFLFCGITANSVSVAHLIQQGVTAMLAGAMIGISGVLNAAARLAGGLLTRFVNARLLLLASLACLIIGLVALSQARSLPMMLVYAAGIGVGYGLTFFASSILLLNYFGRRPYLELFSTVNLISSVGAVAPFLAGLSRDRLGAFTPFFLGLSALVAVVLAAAALMRPPHKAPA